MVDYREVAQKYPALSNELDYLIQQFTHHDGSNNGFIPITALESICSQLSASYTPELISSSINTNLPPNSSKASFDQYLATLAALKGSRGNAAYHQSLSKRIIIKGADTSITHTINQDEKEQFVEHINAHLGGDKDLAGRMPIAREDMSLFEECRDGILLAKLINTAVPDTIDERVLNFAKKGASKVNAFHVTENNNVVINSAKAIGCHVVNIGASDISDNRQYLILGLVWQIIKVGLLAKINLQYHPELFRLLVDGESLEDFMKLPADQILMRWVNYQISGTSCSKPMNNFSVDLKDSEIYTYLLHAITQGECTLAPLEKSDLKERARAFLNEEAAKIGCDRYLTPKALSEGNPRLNLLFTANLFNTRPNLAPLSQAEKAALDEQLFSSEGDREARVFALWMNSLGCDPFVQNLYVDLRDGTILLQTADKVSPGIVNWKKVNKAPIKSKFKRVENCNVVLEIGKQLKFRLIGIQGSDIVDGNKTLTLGFVWQLMREHIVQTLRKLSGVGGKDITDQDMLKWANETVKRGGKRNQASSMKDSSLKTAVFFLELLNGIRPGVVNFDMVSPSHEEEERRMNAKYAISIARKMGATIFLLPEDITDGPKPKLILTFIGSLMAIDREIKAGKS